MELIEPLIGATCFSIGYITVAYFIKNKVQETKKNNRRF